MAQATSTDSSVSGNLSSLAVVRFFGHACFALGFLSIIASILIWQMGRFPDAGHGERFGIFVGLWAPTFFILSDRLDRYGKVQQD